MGTLLILLLVSALVLVGCTPPPQVGPELDPQFSAAPDPRPDVRPPPIPVIMPPTDAGFIAAWVPPSTQPDGTRSSGHWVSISRTPPEKETLAPLKPIPRAPLIPVAPRQPGKEKSAETPKGPVMPPPALPSAVNALPPYPGMAPTGGLP